jgi:hypothetical protein
MGFENKSQLEPLLINSIFNIFQRIVLIKSSFKNYIGNIIRKVKGLPLLHSSR